MTTTPSALEAQSLEASLTVRDIQKSRDWYRDVLGFAIDREFARDEKLFAVSMRAGAVRILITQDDGAKGLDRAKGDGFSLQITTSQDIDAIAKRATDHGVMLATPPTDTPFGVRIFRVQDPDGFKFTFSTPRPQT